MLTRMGFPDYMNIIIITLFFMHSCYDFLYSGATIHHPISVASLTSTDNPKTHQRSSQHYLKPQGNVSMHQQRSNNHESSCHDNKRCQQSKIMLSCMILILEDDVTIYGREKYIESYCRILYMNIVRREYFIQGIIRQASNCLSVCMLSNFNFIHQSIPSWGFLCYISQFPFLHMHHFDHSSQHHIWMEEYHTACKWDTVRLKYSQECWRLPILYIMASTYISKGQEIPSPRCLKGILYSSPSSAYISQTTAYGSSISPNVFGYY